MSLFTIKNYTRYSTEDLTALVDLIEEALQHHRHGVRPERVMQSAWLETEEQERVGSLISFKDFNTKLTWLVTQTWSTSSNRAQPKRRNFVKPAKPWTNDAENDIRIVTPSKLWLNPLEELAACAGGEDAGGGDGVNVCLPNEAQEQIMDRVFRLFEGATESYGRKLSALGLLAWKRVADQNPKIRITDKRGSSLGTKEKQRVARCKALRTWGGADYAASKIAYYLSDLEASHASALGTLRRSKVPLSGREQEVERTITALREALEEARTALSTLREEVKGS